jgi:hypothetical protein
MPKNKNIRRKIKNKVNKSNFNRYKNKKNRVDKNQNRKINQLQRKLKNFSNKINFVLPYQPSYSVSNYHNQLKYYIRGMLFPEEYIDSGIKLPSLLGSYSFCYGFKEVLDFTPGQDGTFKIIWNPNVLSCNNITIGNAEIEGSPKYRIGSDLRYAQFPSRILYSNSGSEGSLTWKTGVPQFYTGTAEGYRLVSASIFIKYVGTNLKKSGYIMSIPSYRPLPIFARQDSQTYEFSSNLIPNIDEAVFVNTKGSLTNFTLDPNKQCKRVWLPCDPSDQIYEDMGYYYSSAVASSQSYVEGSSTDLVNNGDIIVVRAEGNSSYARVLRSEDGNPLKYLFYGKGFQDDNGSIHVSCYYNFELLPSEGVRMPNNEGGKKKIKEAIKQQVLEKAADLIKNSISENHPNPTNADVVQIANAVENEQKPFQQDLDDDDFVPTFMDGNLKQAFKNGIKRFFSKPRIKWSNIKIV